MQSDEKISHSIAHLDLISGSLNQPTLWLPCVKGDSPQRGEMSRRDRGDGLRYGAVERSETEGL